MIDSNLANHKKSGSGNSGNSGNSGRRRPPRGNSRSR
jgi:hypothetical protein